MSTGDSSFFGDASAVIHTQLDLKKSDVYYDIEGFYEIANCIQWLRSFDNIEKVALQFPDELLHDSVSVVSSLQDKYAATYFVLADTSYGSCCVDDVAAQHYNADVLIHFGPSCLSPTNRIPVFWVFGRYPVNVEDCCGKLTDLLDPSHRYLLMYDVQYDYIADELYAGLLLKLPQLTRTHLNKHSLSCSPTSASHKSTVEQDDKHVVINGRKWLCEDKSQLSDIIVIYIGAEGRTLTNLMMVLNQCQFYSYNPETKIAREENIKVNKLLMKRFYMVEKAKDAKIVGLVVGTLGVSNYMDMHHRLRDMLTKAGKKVYSIVVGKLNPAKLGNFMEVDIFVLVACPENSLIDSSDFYKPVVTPFEIELACNPSRQWTGEYTTDFRILLPGGAKHLPLPDKVDARTDVSLITGSMRQVGLEDQPIESSQTALVVRDQMTIAASANNAAEYLTQRTWRGLEKELGQTPVVKAKEGQKGIAIGYEDEPT